MFLIKLKSITPFTARMISKIKIMHQRIAIALNSNAGKGKSLHVANQLSGWLKKKDIPHELFVITRSVNASVRTELSAFSVLNLSGGAA